MSIDAPTNAASVADRFPNDVAGHVMTVLRDDGPYRHLHFADPSSSAFWFDVITSPGRLMFTGDMRTYVFGLPHGEDMLGFFSNGRGIKPSYWSEKVQASQGPVREFSLREAVDTLLEEVAEQLDCEDLAQSELDALLAQVRSDAMTFGENEHEFRDALRHISHPDLSLADTWEWDLTEFTYHYLWCCHALRWATSRYFAATSAVLAATR